MFAMLLHDIAPELGPHQVLQPIAQITPPLPLETRDSSADYEITIQDVVCHGELKREYD